jgi:hypothetical protein
MCSANQPALNGWLEFGHPIRLTGKSVLLQKTLHKLFNPIENFKVNFLIYRVAVEVEFGFYQKTDTILMTVPKIHDG